MWAVLEMSTSTVTLGRQTSCTCSATSAPFVTETAENKTPNRWDGGDEPSGVRPRFFLDGTCLYGFVSSCLGDIDNNGVVGVGDVLLLLNFYGSLCE